MPKGAPAREGSAVFDAAGVEVGTVTSGGYSPCLKKGVGMCYVPPHLMKAGTELTVEVRRQKQKQPLTPCPPATPATPIPGHPPAIYHPWSGPWQEAAHHRHQDALRPLQLLPRPLSAGSAVSGPGPWGWPGGGLGGECASGFGARAARHGRKPGESGVCCGGGHRGPCSKCHKWHVCAWEQASKNGCKI